MDAEESTNVSQLHHSDVGQFDRGHAVRRTQALTKSGEKKSIIVIKCFPENVPGKRPYSKHLFSHVPNELDK